MDTLALRQSMGDLANATEQRECLSRSLKFTVAEHLDPVMDKNLQNLFFQYFLNSEEEIKVAIAGNQFKGDGESYDYAKAYMPMLLDSTSGLPVAAAIVVAKTIKKSQHVHEIVWLAATRERALGGLGGLLFTKIHSMCSKISGLQAILVESTNRALTWWINRPGVPISKYLLRASSRPCLMNPSSKLAPDPAENAKLRMVLERLVEQPKSKGDGASTYSSSTRAGSRRRAPRPKGPPAKVEPASMFSFQPFPTLDMESIYTDTVFRNKRGKPTKSCAIFQGLPYRYTTDQATHLCFPVSKAFRKRLGLENLVINPLSKNGQGKEGTASPSAAASKEEMLDSGDLEGYETASTVTTVSVVSDCAVVHGALTATARTLKSLQAVTVGEVTAVQT